MTNERTFSPTELIEALNQTLAVEFTSVLMVGEVASFKVSQGKWVFFDLKDEKSSVNCFLPLWRLRMPLEDGMKIMVRAVPKLTQWGKFSLTVEAVRPVGEGNLKRAFLMLKKKLEAEGLFAAEKKRPIPRDLTVLGVISSTGAAGYADFVKILNARWGGIRVVVANTQVQGLEAPDQIMRALQYFNERGEVQAIAILRGGGSADDLAAFNDEALVRAVAASKIPVVAGIGHEVDESLVDLAADLRASTPSNAAELLTRDRQEVSTQIAGMMTRLHEDLGTRVAGARQENYDKIERVGQGLLTKYVEPLRRANREKVSRVGEMLEMKFIEPMRTKNREKITQIEQKICSNLNKLQEAVKSKRKILEALNPEKVLRQGYAILSGKVAVGSDVEIVTFRQKILAKVRKVSQRDDII